MCIYHNVCGCLINGFAVQFNSSSIFIVSAKVVLKWVFEAYLTRYSIATFLTWCCKLPNC